MEWDSDVFDTDVFDTDGEDISLAVMRKLANEVSLLKSMDDYKKFNIHLTAEFDTWEPRMLVFWGTIPKRQQTRG